MKKLGLKVIVLAMVLLVGCAKAPDSQQIKTDLIGQIMGSANMFGGGGWKFESLSELRELTIKDKKQQGDLIEYDVSMLLNDSKSGKMYRAESKIVYKKTDGAWKITSVSKEKLDPAQ